MTAYTEEEAGSCWCPLSGRLWEGEGWECLCIGSNCMLSRWADQRPDWREIRMAGLLPGSPEPKRPDIVRPRLGLEQQSPTLGRATGELR
jgi:hypothetical protein